MKIEGLGLTVTIAGVAYTALVNDDRGELVVKPIVTVNVDDLVDCRAKDIVGRVTGVLPNIDGTVRVTYLKTGFEIPEADEHGTPVSKMPNCPRCGEDELGMITANSVLCYKCGWRLE